jgi:hypothetical protein
MANRRWLDRQGSAIEQIGNDLHGYVETKQGVEPADARLLTTWSGYSSAHIVGSVP